MNKRINGHGHLLPTPDKIPAFMKEKKFFWVNEQRSFMCQGDWQRPITDPSFFLEEKLHWMAENNIDHEVVLSLSQLYCNGYSEQDSFDVIRFQNDFNAEVQQLHPDKFTTGFVVQPRHLDQALAEMERCVSQLNMKLLCLSTHFLNAQDEWCSVADESLLPLWQLADELGLALEIHPYDAGRMVNLKDRFWRNHLVWMMAQTADTYLMFTLLGFAERFANVRTCFAHGNMLGHANYGRVVQGVEGRPDLFPSTHHPEQTLAKANVYFDTLVHDVATLDLLIKRAGSAQILWGVDDPYPLGEMATVANCYPGKLLDDAVDAQVISTDQQRAIMADNVLRWLNIAL